MLTVLSSSMEKKMLEKYKNISEGSSMSVSIIKDLKLSQYYAHHPCHHCHCHADLHATMSSSTSTSSHHS